MAGTELDFDKIGQALDRVVAGLNKVDRSLQETGKQVVSFQTLFNSGKGFDDLLAKLKKLSEVDGQKFSRIGFGINQMAEALVKLAGVKTAATSGGNAGDVFGPVEDILKRVGKLKIDPTNINGIFSAISNVSNSLNTVISQSENLPDLGNRFSRVFAKTKSYKDLSKFFDILKFIAESIGKIGRGFGQSVNLESLNTLIGSLGKVGDAIPKILAVADKLPRGLNLVGKFQQWRSLSAFFGTLDTIVKGVVKVTAKIAGEQTANGLKGIRSLSTVLLQISQAIPAIVQAGAGLTGSGFLNLNRILGKGSFGNINKFVDATKHLFSSFKGLPKNLPDLSGFVGGLRELILFNKETQGLDKNSFSGFKDVAKNLADGLKEFSGLKSLPDLSGITSQLRDIQSARGGGSNQPDLSNISDEVVQGLLQAQLIDRIQQGFTSLLGTIANFKQKALEALQALGQQAIQTGQTLLQQAQRIQGAFSLNAIQQSGGFQIAQDFEKTTSLLSAAGLNKDELKLAQDFADTIGIQYPLSANQALDSILALTKAGQDLSNVQLILPAAADLAALTDTGDLDTVTQTLIGVAGAFSQFSDSVTGGFENINTAANLISGAADVSTASVESLSEGLANVGPSANAAGLDLQQTVAILSEFEDANIRGAEAGTALRSVLNSLQAPKARDELLRLNVTTVNTDGTLRDLNDIIQDVNTAYTRLGLTEAQRQQSISQLGDSFARQGLNVLLLRNGYEDTITAINGTATAADKAAQSMDNLSGDTEQLRGSAETLVKDVLLPLIGRVFRPLTQVVTRVVNALLTVPDPIKDIATTAIQLVGSFATLLAGGLALAGVITIIGGTFLELVSSVGLLLVQLPQLIASVVAVGGAFVAALPIIIAVGGAVLLLSTIISRVYQSIENNVDGAGDAFNRFKETVGSVFEEVSRIADDVFSVFDQLFSTLFGRVANQQGNAVANVFLRLSNVFESIRTTLEGIQRSDILAFFQRLSPFIRGLVDSFETLGTGIFETITGNLEKGVGDIRTSVANALGIVTDAIQRVTGLHLGDVVTAFNEGDIERGLQTLFQSIVATVRRLIRENAPRIQEAFTFLLQFFNPFNKVGGILHFLGLDDAANLITGIGNQINDALSGLFSGIIRLISGEDLRSVLGDTLGGSILDLLSSLRLLAAPIFDLFGQIVGLFTGEGGGHRRGNLKDAAGKISGLIEPVGALATVLQFIADKIVAPLALALPGIIQGIEDFGTVFLTSLAPIGPFIQHISGNFDDFYQSLTELFSGSGTIQEVLSGFVNGLVTTLGQLPDLLSQIFINLGQAFQSQFLTNIGDALSSGDLAQRIFNALVVVFNEVTTQIPILFENLGLQIGSRFLFSIGAALRRGNIGEAISIALGGLANAIVDIFNNLGDIVQSALEDLANRAPDEFSRVLFQKIAELSSTFASVTGGLLRIPIDLISSAISALGAILNTQGGPIALAILAIASAVFVLKNNILGLGASFRTLLTQAAEFAALVVIAEALGAAFDNIGKVVSGQQNILEGFLNFFVDLVDRLLALVGLDDEFAGVLGGVRVTIHQLGVLFDVFVHNLIRQFQTGVDAIVVGFQDAFHRTELSLHTGNAATTQFFQVGDTLAQAATTSATQFFQTLGDALANPQDSTTLNAQIRQGAGQIGQRFASFLQQGGTVADLAAQGLLDEVANTLQTAGQIPQALQSLSGDVNGALQLFNQLNPQQQAQNLDAFFNSVHDGLGSNGEALSAFLADLDQLVASGKITQEQADVYRNQLVPSTEAAAAALDTYNTALSQSQAESQATQDAATSYSYTLDGLAESFRTASLSAEDMGSRFRDVVSGLTSDQIDIQSLFDIYNQLSPEEAAASFGDFFQAAIRGGVARAGNEQYFQALQDQIDRLRNSGAITGEQRRTFLDQMAQQAQTASDALDTTTDSLKTLVDSYGRAKEVLGTSASTVTAPTPPATVPPYDPNAASAFTDDATSDISKKISDFAHDEAKRIKDDLADEKKKAEDIQKLKDDSAKEEIQKEKDYDLQTQRREEDHQKALQKIDDDYATQLEDAVANRDSAAAQTALKNKNKQVKDTEEQYKLESDRRQQDEDARRAQAETERLEKIAQAEQDLQDLIAKHTSERLEREADFERELQDTKDKNTAIAAENTAAYQQQVTTNAALVNNTKATTAQIATAVNTMLSSIKGTAQAAQAGGVNKKNPFGTVFGNPFGLDFSGIEQVPLTKDTTYGKGAPSIMKRPINTNPLSNLLGGSSGTGGFSRGSAGVARFDNGGMTGDRSGLALLHPHEVILNQADSKRYIASGGNTDNSSMVVSPNITIHAAPGQSADEIANIVEHRIITKTAEEIRSRTRGG